MKKRQIIKLANVGRKGPFDGNYSIKMFNRFRYATKHNKFFRALNAMYIFTGESFRALYKEYLKNNT